MTSDETMVRHVRVLYAADENQTNSLYGAYFSSLLIGSLLEKKIISSLIQRLIYINIIVLKSIDKHSWRNAH